MDHLRVAGYYASDAMEHIRTSLSIFLFLAMSPFVRDANPGISPGSGETSASVMQRKKALTLHHVTHQILWVAANIEELETCIGNKCSEGLMGRNAYAVPILSQLMTECYIWLHIA